jgi:hypothetical protein
MNEQIMGNAPTEQEPVPTMEKMLEEYRPSKAELLREYEISIRFLHRGCIVRVGCKEIAFTDITEAMAKINEYVAGDTWEIQKQWRDILS